MKVNESTKYKDAKPQKTIRSIRNKLNRLGIMPIETGWNHSLKDFYSVTLTIPNTPLSSNGKGTTYEFALASAYGEMAERLQNMAPFRLSIDLPDEAYPMGEFMYAPDEKYYSIQNLCRCQKTDWFYSVVDQYRENKQKLNTLLKHWKNISYEKAPCDFVMVPYIHIQSSEISYIPIKMASKMYMSNGMCAGNTKEEALIQGICEIFERYANKEIVLKRLTPPTIPETYLNDYPTVVNLIREIERNGEATVQIKDCSMGLGLPVTAVVYIDKAKNSYFIKFGSAPTFTMAVERTLTELLQGQNIQQMKGLEKLQYTVEVNDPVQNMLGILVNGVGKYPREFFGREPSWKWEPFNNYVGDTNNQTLNNIINKIYQLGYPIYIRNVSYMDIPSFHVIISGISEVETFDDINSLVDYTNYNYLKRCLWNLKLENSSSIKAVLDALELNQQWNYVSGVGLLGLSFTQTRIPWYYQQIGLLKTLLYCVEKRYIKAKKYLLNWMDEKKDNREKFQLYGNCLVSILELVINNKTKKEIIDELKAFYPITLIEGCMQDFCIHTAHITKYTLNQRELMQETLKVYSTLKKILNKKHPDQLEFARWCYENIK